MKIQRQHTYHPSLSDRSFSNEVAEKTSSLHIGTSFLSHQRIVGIVSYVDSNWKKSGVDFVAQIARKDHQWIATVKREEFQGNGLKKIAPLMHFLDVFESKLAAHFSCEMFDGGTLRRRVGNNRLVNAVQNKEEKSFKWRNRLCTLTLEVKSQCHESPSFSREWTHRPSRNVPFQKAADLQRSLSLALGPRGTCVKSSLLLRVISK